MNSTSNKHTIHEALRTSFAMVKEHITALSKLTNDTKIAICIVGEFHTVKSVRRVDDLYEAHQYGTFYPIIQRGIY